MFKQFVLNVCMLGGIILSGFIYNVKISEGVVEGG